MTNTILRFAIGLVIALSFSLAAAQSGKVQINPRASFVAQCFARGNYIAAAYLGLLLGKSPDKELEAINQNYADKLTLEQLRSEVAARNPHSPADVLEMGGVKFQECLSHGGLPVARDRGVACFIFVEFVRRFLEKNKDALSLDSSYQRSQSPSWNSVRFSLEEAFRCLDIPERVISSASPDAQPIIPPDLAHKAAQGR